MNPDFLKELFKLIARKGTAQEFSNLYYTYLFLTPNSDLVDYYRALMSSNPERELNDLEMQDIEDDSYEESYSYSYSYDEEQDD